MKTLKRSILSFAVLLAMSLMICGLRPLQARAATKTVKKIDSSYDLTSKIKKKATVVKKGTTTLKVNTTGYLKFKVPATKTYTFTLNKHTSSTGSYNCGFFHILRPTKDTYTNEYHLKNLTFSTQGGKTTSTFFQSDSYTGKITTGSFLPKRTCKIKLKKGQTIYLYLSFANKGSIRLNIK